MTVNIENVGKVHFPEEMSIEDVEREANRLYEESFNVPEEEADFSKGRLRSAGNEISRSVAEMAGQVVSGAGRMLRVATPDFIDKGQPNALEIGGDLLQKGAREAHTVNPKYSREFISGTLPRAVGSTLASGAAAFLGGPSAGAALAGTLYGLSAGEQAATEAEKAGKPDRADLVFFLNAPIGAITEGMLGAGPGLWKVIKKARQAGLKPEETFKALGKAIGTGAAKESGQESLEQVGNNAIARLLYDKERGILEGVGEAAAAGGIVGGGFSGAVHASQTLLRGAREAEAVGANATAQALRTEAVKEPVEGNVAIPPAMTEELMAQYEPPENYGVDRITVEVPEEARTTPQPAVPVFTQEESTVPAPESPINDPGAITEPSNKPVGDEGSGVPTPPLIGEPELTPEQKLGNIVNEAIDAESRRVSEGLGITPGPTKSSDYIVGPSDLKSVSSEVEERWQDAVRHTPTVTEKVFKVLDEVRKSMTRQYSELDETEYAREIDILRRLTASRPFNARRTVDIIKGITNELGPNRYNVFNRVVVLEDLLKDVESGLYTGSKELPFGYTSDVELRADFDKFKSIADANPPIQKALELRREFMNSLRDALVDRRLLPEGVKKDPRYFHHQVLLYMAEKNAGKGAKTFREWFSGWQKGRIGSAKDYNRQYVESEAEVISDSLNRISIQNAQAEMEGTADIAQSLKKIHGGDWKKFIPKTHTIWQTKKGTIMYPSNTVSEQAMEEYLEGVRELMPEEFREALVVGPKRQEWVIPKELAKTLDQLTPQAAKGFDRLAQAGVSSWKQYILHMPLRFLKYNVNNASGDVDFIMAANPGIFKKVKSAVTDIYKLHWKGAPPTGDVKDAMERGAIGSGWRQSELPDIASDEFFGWITGERKGLIDKYWSFVRKISDVREDSARLAVYRFVMERWNSGKPWYGASNPNRIDALPSVEDKAAKITRELMIDYGKTTEFGDFMRRRVVPFWRWAEGNFGRYMQLMRNIPVNEGDSQASAAARIAASAAAGTAVRTSVKWLPKLVFFYGMAQIWNHLFFPDEEEELGNARNQLHLILGRNPDGSIQTWRIQGSLSDVLSWVGAEDLPNDLRQVLSGKAGVTDKLDEAWRAGFSRLINSAQPFAKTGVEALMNRTFFPDATHPRPVRDKMEHVARLFSLGNVYKWMAGIPQAKTEKDLASLISYTVDPGEAAYNTTRQMAIEWMKKQGKDTPSIIPNERSNYLYYHKQALRYGDKNLAEKWLKRYYDAGGKAEGLATSIRNTHPLHSLGRQRSEFMKTLSPSEKAVVDRAEKWYQKVYQR
jgi:hypothetical protein